MANSIRNINPKYFINMFLDGYNKDDPNSIPLQFAKIEDYIIKNVAQKDFKSRYEAAISEFGNWFVSRFETKEIDDFMDLDMMLPMPLILIIYFDYINDDIFTNNYVQWDTYIKMFNEVEIDSTERIISQIAYLNAYYILREEKDELFWDKNINAVVIFYKWFERKYPDEATDAAILSSWNNDVPYIFSIAEDFIDGMSFSDDDLENMIQDITIKYNNLNFTEKRNVDLLVDLIMSKKEDRFLFICPLGEPPLDPISIPAGINTSNKKSKEECESIAVALKGYAACLLEDKGILIISTLTEEDNTISGFYLGDMKIDTMEPEELEPIVKLTNPDTKESLPANYIVENLPFMN